jgi:predicted AlkP superfamily phosphohydrolase/phosphomutase
MPPTSGPSWSSFATGKNPGKTSIYDFLYRRQGTYYFPPINARRRHGRTLWSLLSDADKTVGVLNVPVSYPVEPVNGFMISGFMTPYAARDFVHPSDLLRALKDEFGTYHIYPRETYSEAHPDIFLKACDQLLEMRTRTTLWLMDRYDWDFFITVFFDTDRILHQLWHLLDPTHPWRQSDADHDRSALVLRYFQHLDENLGRILDQVDDDTLVMIMSDHGMGPAHNFVVLNNWLLDVGLLRLKHDPSTWVKRQMFEAGFTLKNVHKMVDRLGLAKHAEYKALYSTDGLLKRPFLSFLNVDWSKSKAYSFGRHTGPIYINVKGREPQGIVEPGREYEAVREDVIALARDFRDPRSGRPIIGSVLRREELYSGPFVEEAPDLTLLPVEETDIFFGLADFGDNRIIDTVYRYSGMHRDSGLLIISGQGIKTGEIKDAAIIDLAPTVLYALGLPILDDMDGRPLLDAFVDEHIDRSPVLYAARPSAPRSEPDYTQEEEHDIEKRLEELGYLG